MTTITMNTHTTNAPKLHEGSRMLDGTHATDAHAKRPHAARVGTLCRCMNIGSVLNSN
jgi:hypothetical protein